MAPSHQRVERRLAAIMAADVAGYSRLVGSDEIGTLRLFTARRKILDSLIAEHRGRIANTAGDSVLAEFPAPWMPFNARWRHRSGLPRRIRAFPQTAGWNSALAST